MDHGFRVTASWRMKQILKWSTPSFNAEGCMSEQRLPHRWKIPTVIRIISNAFCTCYSKCCTSLTVVVQTVDCRCHLRQKYNGFKPGEPAGGAVGLPRRVQCSGNTLLKNSLTARKKRGGAPWYMNHKWIIVCSSTSCNSSIRTFRSKS